MKKFKKRVKKGGHIKSSRIRNQEETKSSKKKGK